MHLAIGAVTTSDDSQNPSPENIEAVAKLDPKVSESLKQGISDLAEMAPCHHFAEQALNILRYLAKKWHIDVDIESDKVVPDDVDRGVKPNTSSLNFFAPHVQEADFVCDWGSAPRQSSPGTAKAEEDATAQKAGDTMDNPLFWPFPMQGRPMLPSGRELEQSGFALL
jgi:hypothetical protein